MKKNLSIIAAFLAVSPALFAQSLNVTSPGYSGGKLFDASPGFTIAGLAVAPGGDVFYIESDSAYTAPSKLYRRSAGDGYVVAETLFNFNSTAFGSFVRWESGRVFFGESTTGAIRLLNPDLSIDALGSVAGNYDATFSGGSIFLSHNPGGFSPQNKVSRFDLLPDGSGGLMLGAADTIMNTPNDYSGPIQFDAAGNLFYGGSGTYARTDLFRFTAAEVAAAYGAGPTLSLDPAHLFLANGANASLALDGTGALWQASAHTLDLIDPTTAASTPIGGTTDIIGQLDVTGPTLYATVTNATFDHSAVFWVVPEPSAAALLLTLSLGALTSRRSRRKD